MAKTRSIPIVQGNDPYSQTEAELHHYALLADYKDYAFYSRLVEGMRRRQGATKDVALRYENQALIDHIVQTRHNRKATSSYDGLIDESYLPDSQQLRAAAGHSDGFVRGTTTATSNMEQEEDMIFDIEI